jgi:hypothetical protein
MSNLTPTPVTDKNGKQTTVHKKTDTNTAKSRAAGVAPKPPVPERSPAAQEILNEFGKSRLRSRDGGKVVSLVDVEELDTKNFDGSPYFRITVENEDGSRYDFLNGGKLEQFKPLRADIYSKASDSTSADQAEVYMGYPIDVGGISDIADISNEGRSGGTEDGDIWQNRYLILTSTGSTPNLSDGTKTTTFNFMSFEGTKFEFNVPDDQKNKLSGIYLQPLRFPWDHYDPSAF